MGLCIIGAKDIPIYMKQRQAILIDLREPDEYRRNHIPDALNVPAGTLQQFMNHSNRNRIHIFYCQHGSLSFQEGKKYVRAGFQICSLAGGMDGYEELTAERGKDYNRKI